METDPKAACIVRVGAPGRWQYKVIAGRENFPVTCVNKNAAAAYYREMNLDQEENDMDPFLASNQNSFSVTTENESAELSLQSLNSSSDEGDLKTGGEIGVVATLGMLVVGMLGRADVVRAAGDGDSASLDPSENNIDARMPSHYVGRMDSSLLSAAGNPPNTTELGGASPCC